ncbi:uncharacterized protein LOC123553284 [Mercenaria mercenaria]|uniref:uncharacterized protein LOC123553284 n=1 Tax=Mercenaria mercenaria TaxID=6596 RepID=UPI001E1DD4A6|nr:uncharacterized protein LOC123553284 [Mercenaria mercenaria]XP_045198959.1 uncharacterized protein LOC123553284 [Mercenaria mercenaria]
MFRPPKEHPAREKRASISRLFSRVHSMLVCGHYGSYDLVKKRKENICNLTSEKPARKTFLPSNDEEFLMALYKEGLLKSNIIIKDGSKRFNLEILVVFVKHEHPAINICMGFTDTELLLTNRLQEYRRYMPNNDTEIDGRCRVRVGINRVLFGTDKADSGARFDGFPVAMWFDVYDPAVEQFLLMKFNARRKYRSIFTQRRKRMLVRPPTNRPMFMGDIIPVPDLYGPRFNYFEVGELRYDRLPIAVMAQRIGELDERQRLRRNSNATNPIDPLLPNIRINDREMSQHFPRRTSVPRNVRRSGSNPDQPDNVERPYVIPLDDDEADTFFAPSRLSLQMLM